MAKTSQTDTFIQRQLDLINTALGFALTPYSANKETGQIKPNPGNIHIDSAYGGYSIRRMANEGTGESIVVCHGYWPKKDILQQLEGFYKGILAAKIS